MYATTRITRHSSKLQQTQTQQQQQQQQERSSDARSQTAETLLRCTRQFTVGVIVVCVFFVYNRRDSQQAAGAHERSTRGLDPPRLYDM
jgi:hypothetical protein